MSDGKTVWTSRRGKKRGRIRRREAEVSNGIEINLEMDKNHLMLIQGPC